MISLEGERVRLRAVEPEDVDPMYVWENDPAVWRVSGTTAPFSRHQLARFVDEQRYDIFQTRQQRLIIEAVAEQRAVGCVDLFEVDPLHARAGVGILIHPAAARGSGFAREALDLLAGYARDVLHLHQLWCSAEASNTASLTLFRRAGYTETGLRRDWLWTPDGFADERFLQLILD